MIERRFESLIHCRTTQYTALCFKELTSKWRWLQLVLISHHFLLNANQKISSLLFLHPLLLHPDLGQLLKALICLGLDASSWYWNQINHDSCRLYWWQWSACTIELVVTGDSPMPFRDQVFVSFCLFSVHTASLSILFLAVLCYCLTDDLSCALSGRRDTSTNPQLFAWCPVIDSA